MRPSSTPLDLTFIMCYMTSSQPPPRTNTSCAPVPTTLCCPIKTIETLSTECSLKIFIENVTLQASYLKFLAYINTILGLLTLIYMEENLIFQDFECIYTFLGSG